MKSALGTIRQIMDVSPSAMAFVDRRGIIAAINGPACRLFGTSKLDAEGRPLNLVVPQSRIENVLADAEPQRYHISLSNESFLASAAPVFNEEKEICGAVECYQEWAELEALTTELEHLKEHNRLLEKILNTAHEYVAAVNPEGLITYMSEETALRMGVDRTVVIGEPMKKVRSDCILHRVARTGVAQIGELWKVNDASVPVMALPIVSEGRIEGAVAKSVFRNMEEARTFLRTFDSESGRVGRKARFTFDDIIGASESLVQAKELARKAAYGESPVMLLAESGCGKEIFAHAIHFASRRHNGPLVSINCACIPESLLESELFGYEDGTFTGARKGGRVGKFEQADGGTIFLDEIGEMSPFMEAKLLRVLQDGEIQKIGARNPRKVDVRVIAATNIDLRAEVRRGEFRKDLYYRLEGISVKLPPLRDRPGDVDLLINHFLPLAAAKAGKSIKGMDEEVRFYLNQYDWPGNVRELLNVIDGAVCLASQPFITWKDIPPHFAERIKSSITTWNPLLDGKDPPCTSTSQFQLHVADRMPNGLEQLERTAIQKALNCTNGNKRRAALLLGIARSTFYEKLKRYGIHACASDIAASG